ncbi:hypothetical protein CPG38_11700 [Malaciobacter marinus]|uniref:hypothetical protein n=1 Tax=Malaciobacter marinus TaxID=505249 RepID=UPI000C06F391|nr:hypothetical protein [Malaciobacter marinus]PHO11684.1 hypothetical protein CPG38_11700 [Malaciobacter marinus]
MKNYSMGLSVFTKYTSNTIIEVDKQSEKKLFEEVYKLAKYFKEELNYDSVPFCPYGDLREEYKALLFIEEPMPYRIYGACSFGIQKFTEEPNRWVLKWIWLHPFFRNRGNLKKNWNKLEEKFGNFLIESPISNDMNSFLENINSKYEHIVI